WFKAGKLACGWTHLRGLNLAERYEPTLELAQAFSEHGPVMTMVPWLSRALTYVERSREIRKTLGDLWGEGQSLHFMGIVYYAGSRFKECMARCSEAIDLLNRTGDRWEVNTARWHIAYCQYRLGALPAALDAAKTVVADAREIGDHSS